MFCHFRDDREIIEYRRHIAKTLFVFKMDKNERYINEPCVGDNGFINDASINIVFLILILFTYSL